jgi:hypothetical protein
LAGDAAELLPIFDGHIAEHLSVRLADLSRRDDPLIAIEMPSPSGGSWLPGRPHADRRELELS